MCVSPHDHLKTSAHICFLLRSYVDWSQISEEFAFHGHRSHVKVILGTVQGHSVRL